MKKRHILQISSYYPPHLGGQENAVRSLATQLAGAGHSVNVLTSIQGGSKRGKVIEDDVQVERFGGFVFGHAPVMPWFPLRLFFSARPDSVVHVHIGQAFTPEMVYFVSKLRGFNYVAQLHIDFEPSGPAGVFLPFYKRFVLAPALRSAAAIVTLNEKTKRTVREKYGYKGNVQVLNNGIDEVYFLLKRPSFAATPPKVLHLLFVGRLSKQKNIPELLKALRATKRKVHLDLVGDGEESAHIKIMVEKLGLAKIVTMHGRLDKQQVMRFYETNDALIMPSLYEAQPLVLLEAMAARIPIIGTDVIGVVDHIKDIGIIAKPTAEGLVEAIERYFTQYVVLPKMVQRGYEKAEKFRWPQTLKKYERLYESVLGD